jgi:hypothetical protein
VECDVEERDTARRRTEKKAESECKSEENGFFFCFGEVDVTRRMMMTTTTAKITACSYHHK